MPKDFDELLNPVLVADPRYTREAYHFVREALDFTQELIKRRGESLPRPALGHHITGQELLSGIKDFALVQFGPMSRCVLEEWGITRCEDFGAIVFNLVEHQILSKTEKDRPEDFSGGYDFTEAFVRPFQPTGKATDVPPACDESK